jgi:3D (Asp-Asp-Asp) domain-containing protein
MPKLLAILSLLFVFAMPVYGMQVRCTAYTTTENTGIMANGMEAQVGYVACDFLPLGTVIYIDGARYIVGDRIGDGTNNHIDIVFNSYDEAINFGVQYLDMEVA